MEIGAEVTARVAFGKLLSESVAERRGDAGEGVEIALHAGIVAPATSASRITACRSAASPSLSAGFHESVK